MACIVVTGMGMLAPKFGTLPATMEALIAGQSTIEPLGSRGFDLLDTKIGGLVPDTILEELLTHPALGRISKWALRPSKLALAAALQALQQACLLEENGKIPAHLQDRTAAFVGTGVGASEAIADVGTVLFRLQQATEEEQATIRKEADRRHLATGMNALPDAPVFQVSQAFGITGMIGCLSKACTTGAGNIQLGAILLEGGYADIAVCGGTESLAPNDIYPFSVYARKGALSQRNEDPKGASRPFDRDHDGFVPAEGAAVLVLEREEHALARGVTPLAVLAGWGERSDAKGTTDPDFTSQAQTIQLTLQKARIFPREVDVFVAHGTSTDAGDKSELLAFKQVFGSGRNTCITAPKSVTGHTLGAAGAVQAAFGIEMIQRGIIPLILNLKNPIPEADGLNLVQSTLNRKVNIVVCNAAGFGGQNVCLVFRKWQE